MNRKGTVHRGLRKRLQSLRPSLSRGCHSELGLEQVVGLQIIFLLFVHCQGVGFAIFFFSTFLRPEAFVLCCTFFPCGCLCCSSFHFWQDV